MVFTLVFLCFMLWLFLWSVVGIIVGKVALACFEHPLESFVILLIFWVLVVSVRM
jgi:hypothetical protein